MIRDRFTKVIDPCIKPEIIDSYSIIYKHEIIIEVDN